MNSLSLLLYFPDTFELQLNMADFEEQQTHKKDHKYQQRFQVH